MRELPLSLSIVTNDGMCTRMLDRGSEVPVSAERVFTTKKFMPSAVMAEIVLGERALASDNMRVIRVRLGGIKKSVGNIARISVKMEVLEDGSLVIELFDLGSHHRKKKVLKEQKWIPDPQTVERALYYARQNYEEDRRIEEYCKLTGKARTAILIANSLKRVDKKMLTKEELAEVRAKADDLKKRIRVRPSELSNVDAKIIKEEINALYKILDKITPPG